MDSLGDFGKEAIRQAPGLTILGFAMLAIVYMFLRHLREERVARTESDKSRTAAMHEIGVACHAFQEAVQLRYHEDRDEMATVIGENTAALTANTKALGRIEGLLDERSTFHRRKELGGE